MTLIKLNDGESITVQMNFDKSKTPHSITIMRRGNWMGVREFGDSIMELSEEEISIRNAEEVFNKMLEEEGLK